MENFAARGQGWDSSVLLWIGEDRKYLEVLVNEESAVADGCLGCIVSHQSGLVQPLQTTAVY